MNHYQGSISFLPKSGLLTQTNKIRLTEDIQNSSFNVFRLHKADNPTPPALHEQRHLLLDTDYYTSSFIRISSIQHTFNFQETIRTALVIKTHHHEQDKRGHKLYISVTHLPMRQTKLSSPTFVFNLNKMHEPEVQLHSFHASLPH